jgi:predicted N-formylglutamate amidohydrolase
MHAAPRGLEHVMIEIRNDLVSDGRGQEQWAERLRASLGEAGKV